MTMQAPNGGHSSHTAILPSRSLLFLANSFFVVVLAFVAGYNFKGYQVRRHLNEQMAASDRYMEDIRANYEKSNEILRELNVTYQTHYEKKIEAPLRDVLPAEPPSDTAVQAFPAPKPAERPLNMTPESAVTEAVPPAPALSVNPISRPVARPKKPAPTGPYVHVRHRIAPGDVLSALVPRREMPFFLDENPEITHPDQIFPGQSILIRVPEQNILRGTYMNSYFIRPCDHPAQNCTYTLIQWLAIPENQSVLNYLIHEDKQTIKPATVPFIDFSDEANHIKDRLLGHDLGEINTRSRIRRLNADHGPMLFRTDPLPKLTLPGSYRGLRETGFSDFDRHRRVLANTLSHYYSGLKGTSTDGVLYHFFVFGDTVVQVAYLGPEHFEDTPDKQRILIGLAHSSERTPQALSALQQALGVCRVRRGDMALVDPANLSLFLK